MPVCGLSRCLSYILLITKGCTNAQGFKCATGVQGLTCSSGAGSQCTRGVKEDIGGLGPKGETSPQGLKGGKGDTSL